MRARWQTVLTGVLSLVLSSACSNETPPVWQPDVPPGGAAGTSVGWQATPHATGGTGHVDGTVCETTRDGIWLECRTGGLSMCEPNQCEIEGACVGDGAATSDGCCHCAAGVSRCLKTDRCPSSKLIGRRCQDDRDCSFPGTRSDLHCRAQYVAAYGTELRVCTRPCTTGCAIGFDCLQVPNEAGEVLVDAVCMRRCSAQADCERYVGGAPLASACASFSPDSFNPFLTESYCF